MRWAENFYCQLFFCFNLCLLLGDEQRAIVQKEEKEGTMHEVQKGRTKQRTNSHHAVDDEVHFVF